MGQGSEMKTGQGSTALRPSRSLTVVQEQRLMDAFAAAPVTDYV